MQKLELKDLLTGFNNNQIQTNNNQEVLGSNATQ
jgi:hypothetical protein